MNLKSKKGFTLVELIIVIAILGVIALIAVPNLTTVQKQSQINADKRTAEQIGRAVRIWLTDSENMSEINKREAQATLGGSLKSFASAPASGEAPTTFLSSYISTGYIPKAQTGMEYYIKMTAGNVIEVAIGAKDGSFNKSNNYALVNGAVQAGLAYQEGSSGL